MRKHMRSALALQRSAVGDLGAYNELCLLDKGNNGADYTELMQEDIYFTNLIFSTFFLTT